MIRFAQRSILSWWAIAGGLVLLGIALWYTDFSGVIAAPGRFLEGLVLSIVVSAVWHAIRTWMWTQCFARPAGFARLARIRLIGEAFSYLTITGVGGDPIKWLLLRDGNAGDDVAASLVRERLAYLTGTIAFLTVASLAITRRGGLPDNWDTVFLVIAISGGLITVIAGMLIAATRHVDRLRESSPIRRAVRWIKIDRAAVTRGLEWRRLAALAIGSAAAFISMVLEVWMVVRVAGLPLTVGDAVAIETVSRVGTFASALVPGSLGVLEISTLSAAMAIGLPSAAAPLALTRRLRGLFWAAVGLLLYGRLRSGIDEQSQSATPPRDPRILLYLASGPTMSVTPMQRVAGLPIAERVVRAACRAGYDEVIIYAGHHYHALPRLDALTCRIRTVSSTSSWIKSLMALRRDLPVTIVGEGVVPSVKLLASALTIDGGEALTDVPAGIKWPRTGIVRTRVSSAIDLPSLSRTLSAAMPLSSDLPSARDVVAGRGHLVLRASTLGQLEESERIIRAAAYKPTDGTVARFNRRLSLPISIALMRTPITANQLSTLLVAVGLWSAWLFSRGSYGAAVAGAALSLAASILDGCDGEIARLKYQESSFGCWLETLGDYAYYVAILIGITVGVVRSTGLVWLYTVSAAAMAGTALSFAMLLYLRRRITGGQPDQLHAIAKARFNQQPTWWSRRLLRLSSVATRASMPYGVFVLAAVGALPVLIVLWAIAGQVYWISLCLKLRDLLNQPTVDAPVLVRST
jgi:phosphatidylglycerophosphate synthase